MTPTINADELSKLLERIPPEWNPDQVSADADADYELTYRDDFTGERMPITPRQAASLLLGGIMQEMNARKLRPKWDSGVHKGQENLRVLWCHRDAWCVAIGKRSIRGIGQTDLHAAVAAVEAISKA